MIALSLFRKNELSSSCTRICVIDEFHVTTEPDDRIRRDIIWRDIRAIDLLAKKASSLLVHGHQRVAKQRKQLFTVRCGQDDGRPLFETILLDVAHAHVFPADILPSAHEVAACEQSRFRTLGRDILQERRTEVPARVCHRVRHDWTLLTFDTRVMISTN